MIIALNGISTRVLLENCDELIPPLTGVLGSWSFRCQQNTDASGIGAAISVSRNGSGYRVTSPWLTPPVLEQSEVGAVFSVTAEVARAFAEERRGSLCLHCAAIEIDRRLIIFPNTENAGKSTLAVKLASQGFRMFADDVLPISEVTREGTSLGVAPRLRLPLPATADVAFRDFVKINLGPHDDEFAYLTLPANLLAPHGQSATIGGVVLLDRLRSGAPQLAGLPRGQSLQQLIVQNFAPGGTTMDTVDRLHSLLEPLPCFSLTYSDLDQAAALVRDRFSGSDIPWRKMSEVKANENIKLEIAVEVQSKPSTARTLWFEQIPGILLREVDDDLFLVKPEEDGVFHLNPVATTLWRLLEKPTTLAMAIDVLREAFPAANVRRVKRDVRNLFDTFAAGGLIRHGKTAHRDAGKSILQSDEFTWSR